MNSRIFVILAVSCTTLPALAANVIREWSGHYQLGTDYSIVGNTVLIHRNSVQSILWKFEAYDSVTNAPGVIDDIRIQPTGSVGWIRLRVQGDALQGRSFGARDVKRIDLLTNADSNTEVFSIFISGDFGQNGPMSATFVGGLYMEGDLLGGIFPNISISGDLIVLGNLLADINASFITGDVTASGAGPHTGNFTVSNSPFSRNLTFGGDMLGNITFSGTAGSTMSGLITVRGDLSGNLDLG